MYLIKNLKNSFFKIFNYKLIKIVDQFSNSFRLVLSFKEKNIDYVFDVGANEGQFAKDLRYYGFEKKILSFEPVLTIHEKLVKNSLNDEKWEIYEPIALGNKSSKNEINISQNSVSSSLLNMTSEHLESAPESKFIGKQSIMEKKLDDIFFDLNIKEKKLFLKIDTQGYEYEVLKGAEEVLKKFKGVLVEVSLTNLYEGQKDWLEIVTFLKNRGFTLWSVDRGFSNKKNGKTLQLDICFFK